MNALSTQLALRSCEIGPRNSESGVSLSVHDRWALGAVALTPLALSLRFLPSSDTCVYDIAECILYRCADQGCISI